MTGGPSTGGPSNGGEHKIGEATAKDGPGRPRGLKPDAPETPLERVILNYHTKMGSSFKRKYWMAITKVLEEQFSR